MKTHGTLLLLVGTLTLTATAPTPRHQLQQRDVHQQQTTQPEYEYDYEGTAAAQAEPEESASHYDAYIAEVQQSNADKKGYSRGSGLRTIAVGSANQAKTALGNQAAAGYQAAYVAKNTLAQSAAQASATAQAALAGKQVIMSGLEQQVRDAKVALQGEEMQLQQAKRAAQSAAQAAQQAMHQVNVIQAALNAAQATSENANEAASQAAGEFGAQTAMVGAARQRVSTLQDQLHGVRIDFEATQAAARKAQGAAQQAQANAAEAAAKAAAAGLGGHKDAAYEALLPKYEESKQELQTSKRHNIISTTAASLLITPNIGPVKFEFVIPPLLDVVQNEQERLVSISNELGHNKLTTKSTELDPRNNDLLTTQANISSTQDTIRHNVAWNESRKQNHVKRRQSSENDLKDEIGSDLLQMLLSSRDPNYQGPYNVKKFALPNTTQKPHTFYWLNTRAHEALENVHNDPNSEEAASKHTLHAMQKPSFREPKLTQPVNEDHSESALHASNQMNHANYLSEFRYNPSKYEKLHRGTEIVKTNQLESDDRQKKNATVLTRSTGHTLPVVLRIPRTTQANWYLKQHTANFIYVPRYQFHDNPKHLESNARLNKIRIAPQNTSFTISNLTDPDYKRTRKLALFHANPTPRKEIQVPQKYPSVVEKALQNALNKIPMSEKLGQSSTPTLIPPIIKPTPYKPWHITYKASGHVTPQQDYPKIYSQINIALKKYKLSKWSERDYPETLEQMKLALEQMQQAHEAMHSTQNHTTTRA